MKKVILLLLVGAIAGGVVFYHFRMKGSAEGDQLVFSGTIETTQVEASFLVPGRMDELFVDEGYSVDQGEVIARLDRRELVQAEKQALANLQAAQGSLELLRTRLALTEATVATNLEAARARVSEATHVHTYWVKELKRVKELYERKSLAEQNRDQVVRSQAEAEDKLNVAQANLSQARAQTLEIDRLKQEMVVQQARVSQAEAQLGFSRVKLKDSVLLSPLKGYVLVKSAEQGEYVTPGTTVVTIAELHKVWLRCYVNETDLARVILGQTVNVTTDTFPNKIYKGRISFISSNAEFTPKNIQTQKERVKLVYRMKVDLDNPNLELKPGLPADGRLVEEKKNLRESNHLDRPGIDH
jgi:HlyD family secretion protein